MRVLLLLLLGLALGGASVQAQPTAPAPASTQREVLPDAAVPTHYALRITPDAEHLRFAGEAEIDLTVRRATDTLTLNAADLVISQASIDGSNAPPVITYDAALQRVSLRFDRPIAPGARRLRLAWTGMVFQSAQGLFALDYDADGRQRRALYTQFEPTDARRLMPCWDEPGLKATFDLTVVAPTGQMAVSNMPVAEAAPAGAGLTRTHFATTPAMSTYLLFLGVGDFERIHRRVGNVDVGVIARRGAAEEGRFALDAAAELLPYYERYFGTPYPLPKLDMIAGPGRSQFFGAMENWGAIFYFESELLAAPDHATQTDRQRVFGTVAHEIAHQWFGDLVTMAWWDDLWLNEGFASWMATRATADLHADWNPWLQSQISRDRAMRLDARASTHPVIQPVRTAEEANQAFDQITYDKGEAVIRMLEAFVGRDRFQRGVAAYFRAHAYRNTVTEDLWREVGAAAPDLPVLEVARDFTTTPGVPLVTVTSAGCEDDGVVVSIDQRRLAVDGSTAGAWRVPLRLQTVTSGPSMFLRTLQGLGPERVRVARIIDSIAPDGRAASPSQRVPCPATLINREQTAYARVAYDDGLFGALAPHFATLQAQDQLGLLQDAWALGRAGAAPWSRFLELVSRLSANADPVIWGEVVDDLDQLDRLYTDGPARERYRAWARTQMHRGFDGLGWRERRDESPNAARARTRFIIALGRFGDAGVRTRARELFDEWREHPDALTPDLRQASLVTVAETANPALWESFRAQAAHATTPDGKETWYDALTDARDPALVARTLALAISGEPPATLSAQLIGGVAEHDPDAAFRFAVDHARELAPFIEASSRTQFVPRLARGSSNPETARTLLAWAAANAPGDAGRPARLAAEEIEERAAARGRLGELDAWLVSHG